MMDITVIAVCAVVGVVAVVAAITIGAEGWRFRPRVGRGGREAGSEGEA